MDRRKNQLSQESTDMWFLSEVMANPEAYPVLWRNEIKRQCWNYEGNGVNLI